MLDENVKADKQLLNIKNEMIKYMLKQYTEDNISEERISKVIKFINFTMATNQSTNNFERRINGIYKVVKKAYKDFLKLDDGIFN